MNTIIVIVIIISIIFTCFYMYLIIPLIKGIIKYIIPHFFDTDKRIEYNYLPKKQNIVITTLETRQLGKLNSIHDTSFNDYATKHGYKYIYLLHLIRAIFQFTGKNWNFCWIYSKIH